MMRADLVSGSDASQILSLAERVARERIAPLAAAYDRRGDFPRESYEALREAGLTAMTVPRRYGGLGVDLPAYCDVLAILASACGSTALTLNMHSSVVRMIDAMGSEDQRARYLREAAEGKLFASLTSEPASSLRRNFRVETRAAPVDGGYVLSGLKYFCSSSSAADYFFVWAMPPGAERLETDLLNVVVPARAAGIQIEDTWDAVAMRATASHSVRFDGVFVAEGAVIGGPGGAVRHRLTHVFMPGYAAVYLGLAQAALDRAVDYARHRAFGDRTPADDPVVQHHVGRMSALVAGARAMMHAAALLAGGPPGPEAALALNQAKYLSCEAACRVADLALQVVGGRALYMREDLQRIFRDAHVGMLMPPSNDHALEIAGQLTLGFDVAGGFLG
jgi:alkylation response protein AidB-like acyl-CoA dehydrogenase